MKATVDIPDSIYRQIEFRAALRGQSVKAFFLEAVRDKLLRETAGSDKPGGWRSVFGQADKKVVAELQEVIDAEFSQIDPDGWE